MGKIMLNGVDYSAPSQSGVSGVKGNAETTYRQGQVNLTPENLGALKTNGDSKDVTTSFTSSDVATANATAWTNVNALTSGEKHSSIFAKVSQMFKNIRYLYNNKIDLSKILTTVEQCTASTDNNNIASAAVIKELNSNLSRQLIQTNERVSFSDGYISVYPDKPALDGYTPVLIAAYPNTTSRRVYLSGLIPTGSVHVKFYADGTIDATVSFFWFMQPD